MSVISRQHSIPKQRSAKGSIGLDAPAPRSRAEATSDAAPSRRSIALLVAGAAAVAAAAGTGAYVVLDDEPAAVTTTVDIPSSELSRDAAAARRSLDRRLATEAQRDAAAASRAESQVDRP